MALPQDQQLEIADHMTNRRPGLRSLCPYDTVAAISMFPG
jgi:hypothetical protein